MGGEPRRLPKIKKKQVDYIAVKPCVILIRTKVVVKETPGLVTIPNSGELVSNSYLPVSVGIVRKQKKKGFILKSREMSIMIAAPMETFDRPAKKVTGVPPGTMNK